MPYEKTPSTRDEAATRAGSAGVVKPSFEVLYTGFRSSYNPNAGNVAGGFQLMSTNVVGEAVFQKMIIGAEANRIVWLFNTTTSDGTAETDEYSKGLTSGFYDRLPGVTTMSFYQADGSTKIGEVTHSRVEGWDRVGGGTSQQGYISSPPPFVQFTVSSSHNMQGILKVVNSAVGDYGDKTKTPII